MSRTGSSHPCIRSATETLNSCTFRTRTTYKSCILGLEPCIILPNIEQNRVRSSMAQVAITVAPAVYAALPSSTNILYNTPSSRDTNKARDIWQKATPAYPENPASFSSPPGATNVVTPMQDALLRRCPPRRLLRWSSTHLHHRLRRLPKSRRRRHLRLLHRKWNVMHGTSHSQSTNSSIHRPPKRPHGWHSQNSSLSRKATTPGVNLGCPSNPLAMLNPPVDPSRPQLLSTNPII